MITMLAIGLICVVVGFIAGYRCRLSLPVIVGKDGI